MNGLCYIVPLDFKKENIVKIPALINKEKQTKGEDEWNYGMGCMGSAAHFTRSVMNIIALKFEPSRGKNKQCCFRTGLTQIRLYSHRSRLEA